jgi:hypothetical protein
MLLPSSVHDVTIQKSETSICIVGSLRNADNILVENPEGKRPLRKVKHSWETILEWILGKWVAKYGMDTSGSG